jgi:hypothetical protein
MRPSPCARATFRAALRVALVANAFPCAEPHRVGHALISTAGHRKGQYPQAFVRGRIRHPPKRARNQSKLG